LTLIFGRAKVKAGVLISKKMRGDFSDHPRFGDISGQNSPFFPFKKIAPVIIH
jgi:hypothetical protein